MTPKREEKFKAVIEKRQPGITVILENVNDHHNIGAVLRSCDSIGIMEVFILYNMPGLRMKTLKLGKRTSAGARRWVDVHLYTDTAACFAHVRQNYDRIYGTHLSEDAVSVYEMDLTHSIAFVFGNEHKGISEASLLHIDGNFIIPQVGMVESLNISVACAVTLYEAFRQRLNKGMYAENAPLNREQQVALYQKYKQKHILKVTNKKIAPTE